MLVDEEALAKQLQAHPELRAVLSQERALREEERAQLTSRIAELEAERDRLRASHERLRQELEVFKRRLFIAKAERIDTRQLELEYAQKLRELDHLAGRLGLAKEPDCGASPRLESSVIAFATTRAPRHSRRSSARTRAPSSAMH